MHQLLKTKQKKNGAKWEMHENPEALQIVEVHKQQLQRLNPSSPLGPMLCIIDLARAPPPSFDKTLPPIKNNNN